MSRFLALGVLVLLSVTALCKKRILTDSLMIQTRQDEVQATDVMTSCRLCQFTVKHVLQLIGNELSKDSIEKALDQVCTKLLIRGPCVHFIDNYKHKLVRAISSAGSVRGTCRLLHFCT